MCALRKQLQTRETFQSVEEMSLTDKPSKFPKTSLIVLAAGLIAVSVIAFISFSPTLSPNTGVSDIAQAEDIVEKYLAALGNDFEIEEIMEFSNHFYIIIQEESTGVNVFELLVD